MSGPKTIKNVTRIKKTLSGIGGLTAAISGVCMGLLSIVKVFYPDPQKQSDITTVNNNPSTSNQK